MMKYFLILIFSVLIHSINSDDNVETIEKGGAIELDEKTFEDYIKTNRLVLVMFYAPWCGHCKEVMPIFNKVDKILNDDPSLTEIPIKLVKVNVSNNTALGEKYNIFRFPTLMYFRDNFYIYPFEGSDVTNPTAILNRIKLEAVEKWTPPEKFVKELTLDNFDEWINNNKISLVQFYTVKCAFCIRLEQEFEEAAKTLIKDEIHLGRVDGKKELILKSRYQVSRYPTLIIFRDGRNFEYTGQKDDYQQIVKFMKKFTKMNSKEIKSFAEFKTFVNHPINNYVIGLFNNDKEDLYQSLIQFSSRYPDDFKLFHSFEISDFEKSFRFKVQRPAIVVYYHDAILTSKESNFRVFNDSNGNIDAVEDFIMRKSLPLIGVMNNENKNHIYKHPRPICYAFYSLDHFDLLENTLYYRDKLIKAARKNPAITFVICDEAIHADLVEKFNLQEAKGDVSLVCLNVKSQKFIFDNEDSFEEDEIDEFVTKFMRNELKPTYKSEIEPKDNSKKLVKILTGSTFVTTLDKNRNKHAVIYFYTNDCEDCVAFDLIFQKLAKHFSKNKKLFFGKMNVDFNEYPIEYESNDYPAIFIRRENEFPVLFDYTKETTVDDLTLFLNEIMKSDEQEEKPKVSETKVENEEEPNKNNEKVTPAEKLETKKEKEDDILIEEEPKKEKTVEQIIPEVMADASKVKRVKVVSERKVEL